MNIHLAPIHQNMTSAFVNNARIMKYMVDADMKLKNETCPNHSEFINSVTVLIPEKTPLEIQESFCCQEFREHAYSICDIPTVVGIANLEKKG
jgi:hypothetical protein